VSFWTEKKKKKKMEAQTDKKIQRDVHGR
jgi:hypothetical protein